MAHGPDMDRPGSALLWASSSRGLGITPTRRAQRRRDLGGRTAGDLHEPKELQQGEAEEAREECVHDGRRVCGTVGEDGAAIIGEMVCEHRPDHCAYGDKGEREGAADRGLAQRQQPAELWDAMVVVKGGEHRDEARGDLGAAKEEDAVCVERASPV